MEEESPVYYTLRSAPEIARRALTLSAVISVAHGDSRDDVSDWLRQELLWSELSPQELAFVTNREPTRKEVVAFSWHVERLVPLLWSLQKISSMPPLTSQCDTIAIKSAVVWPPAPTKTFIETAALRREEEIDEEYERVYQAHWRVRDAEIKKLPVPEGLNGGAVFERHWGFNWLFGYFGQPWDEIKTDT